MEILIQELRILTDYILPDEKLINEILDMVDDDVIVKIEFVLIHMA
jgi:hypothetical protein